MQNLKTLILMVMISLFYARDAYDGYLLFTPGGQGSGNNATTYLRDNSGNNIQSISIPIAINIRRANISLPEIIGVNHMPNAFPIVTYAVPILLNTETFIWIV